MKVMLGKRIREERIELNLTQETFAENVDLTTAYIGQIERGERNLTLKNLVKVSNRLGVSVDYLLIYNFLAMIFPLFLVKGLIKNLMC